MKQSLFYTITDEAPALATRAFLPVVQAFCSKADIDVEPRDISLAGRILAVFNDSLSEEQRIENDLERLGKKVFEKDANIIKLPNISASLPQLKAAIAELQKKGFTIPDYPDEPSDDQEKEIKNRYDRIKGSAVNPVLREGNSDRRAPKAVKQYARKNPHSMGVWSRESRTRVASMDKGDFYDSEKSITVKGPCQIKIVFDSEDKETVLKDFFPLLKDEVIDSAFMDVKTLEEFLDKQISAAADENLLFSLHLKATMMKVSDPVIFGHAVSVYFASVFEKYGEELKKAGISPDNGLGDLLERIKTLPQEDRRNIRNEIQKNMLKKASLAMVDSDKGITNLHVPSDVIIDASMPAAIRSGGKMWGPDGKLKDMIAVIPDRSYAGVYQAAIDFCRENGALDPSSLGSVSNIGLMAQKAEEYGSHDKTFVIPDAGSVKILDDNGKILMEQKVGKGDIFRMCQVKDAPVQNWVSLAVERARLSGTPVVFWLDDNRAHDRELIQKVNTCLNNENTDGLDISIQSPVDATHYSFERMVRGLDTISATGNVLRDFLTDLFPILELGTSAKMLSIVPLMSGGGLFETGAGGSAPKHVQQFLKENHLRWDSLGEYLALGVSLEHLSRMYDNRKAAVLAVALDAATEQYLLQNKSPSRKSGEPDNRSSHFYLTLFWAEALADQEEDSELRMIFAPIAEKLRKNEKEIAEDFLKLQGTPVDMKGYYKPDESMVNALMRPSRLYNRIISELKA